ncbi:MAG: hypothetical protein LV481_08030, partial [Methylacidiphilales bacterium]|nr:hypothetical protein [Candidatus Methylacidiphilales bacterium]
MSRTLRLCILAMLGLLLPGGRACAERLSPLAPKPDWSSLEAYQKTITRAEFTRLINQVYTPDGGFWDFANINDDKVVVYSDSAKTEPLFTLHFAPNEDACAPLPYTYK